MIISASATDSFLPKFSPETLLATVYRDVALGWIIGSRTGDELIPANSLQMYSEVRLTRVISRAFIPREWTSIIEIALYDVVFSQVMFGRSVKEPVSRESVEYDKCRASSINAIGINCVFVTECFASLCATKERTSLVLRYVSIIISASLQFILHVCKVFLYRQEHNQVDQNGQEEAWEGIRWHRNSCKVRTILIILYKMSNSPFISLIVWLLLHII